MAKPRGKPFAKGNKLGTGRPALPEDLKYLMEVTGFQVRRDLCECYNTHIDTLTSLAQRTDVPSGLAMIASCMVNAIQTGDNRIMATFLDRLIGKPKEIVELEGTSGLTVVVKDYTKKEA